MGARRIGVTSLPPIGCLPATITLYGEGSNECVDRINNDAKSFNSKLNFTSQRLLNTHSDLKLVIFDVYQPLYDIVTSPADHGNITHMFSTIFTSLYRKKNIISIDLFGSKYKYYLKSNTFYLNHYYIT